MGATPISHLGRPSAGRLRPHNPYLRVYGVDLFTSRVSFVFLVAGLVWTFFGNQILREVIFPIAVLLLAIPFPAIIFNQITFPLQLLASRLASMILPLLGVPVLQEGNVIQLPVMKLEVAEACSGIRSLMSLLHASRFLSAAQSARDPGAGEYPDRCQANVAASFHRSRPVLDPAKALGFFTVPRDG